MAETVIRVENLQKEFRIWNNLLPARKSILRNLSFEVCKGEAVAFLGPNGAGKTTTIQHLLGFLTPTSGSIDVLGKQPGDPENYSSTGYLSEIFNSYTECSAEYVLKYYGRLLGIEDSVLKKTVPEKLEMVGLLYRAGDRIGTFSKGMMQRLGLAQSLIHDPELLILDEPMTGLDPEGRNKFIELINYEKEKGTTVFFSSHILWDVERICDRAILIKEGEVLKDITVSASDKKHSCRVQVIATRKDIAGILDEISEVDVKAVHSALALYCDPAKKQSLLQKLVMAGVEIDTVTMESPSLEQEYLDLMGKE